VDESVPSGERALAGLLVEAGRLAEAWGLPAYLVGGAVRDLLLGRSLKDLDLAVVGSAESVLELARRLSELPGWRQRACHRRFGTATLEAPGGPPVDIAATRTEVYPRPAALPVVTAGAPIEEDLGRRDFTIHAMARGVSADGSLGPLLDPFGGKEDVDARLVRLLHARSLADDPTRAWRAVRYAVRLGFGLDKRLRPALALARGEGAFHALSGDRFRRALEEVLEEDDFGKAKSLLLRYELLDDICPGWGEGLQREISSKVMERRAGSGAVKVSGRWTSLLSCLSPSQKKYVSERLKFSRALRRATGVPPR
jgi:tRNA nucleotidyltransferase (CCA-adding enzyme)